MAIPSVNLVLRKKKPSDDFGFINIRIQIPGKRQGMYKSLGHRIAAAAWDKDGERVLTTELKHNYINTDIEAQRSKLKTRLLVDDLQGGQPTELYLKGLLNISSEADDEYGSFTRFYAAHIDYMSTPDKEGNAKFTAGYLDHFKTEFQSIIHFAGKRIEHKDITADFLRKHEMYLLTGDPALKRKGVKRGTTLHTKMKRLKEVIDLAIESELISRRAIAGYKWPKYTKPEKTYLTLPETDAIAALVYDNKLDNVVCKIVACYFLIECWSGIRFSDWGHYKMETLIDNEAFKVRARKNGEYVYLHLDHWPRLRRMLNYIRDNEYTFTYLERTTNAWLSIIAIRAGIDKELTTHVGRHTCATLLSSMRYTTSEIADILGASEQTVLTYIHPIQSTSKDVQEKLGGL